jgi:aminoglycoside phosphotransferase (APT) family kinase protein
MTGRSLQPETALGSWRQWGAGLQSRPVILGALGGGRSNHSFLLDSGIGKLVLRVHGGDSFLPGASRGNEAFIWQAASRAGIAPPLVFADEDDRYLISAYIESHLPANPRASVAVRDQAFSLLKACHRMEVGAPVIDYAGHIEHYWRVIEAANRPVTPALLQQRGPMRAVLESLVNSGTPTGLCHHDPVIENFVGNPGRLYLIDWEYAATGLQIMDYAALATEWQIDDGTIHAKTGLDPVLLNTAKTVYSYLCSLWKEATS